VARISEINEGLYNTLVSPWLRMGTNRMAADWLRLTHPERMQRLALSDLNPWMWGIQHLARVVKDNRAEVGENNAFLQAQKRMSGQIEAALDRWRDARDAAAERLFFAIYESPAVRALAGLAAPHADENKPRARDDALEALLREKTAVIRARIDKGGFPEAVMRILLAGTTAQHMVDARGARIAGESRRQHPLLSRLTHQEIRALAREQAFLLNVEGDRALEALPALLPSMEERREAMAFVHGVVQARGAIRAEAAAVLKRVEQILGVKGNVLAVRPGAPRLRAAPARRLAPAVPARRRKAAARTTKKTALKETAP